MTVLRGATTVEKDSPEFILAAVKELLDEIFRVNSLKSEEIRCFVFSLTTDIHSFHPAKAARECGYDYAPLFACIEPDIDGGLKKCIRVMIFVEREHKNEIKHVYLQGAKTLRKDISEIMNIALDGPAGSGKSTIAKAIAKDYNILYLDTGAMYRACGLKALQLGVDPQNREEVEKMIPLLDVKVEYREGKQHTILDGKDVSTEIRQNKVSMAASHISAHQAIREKLVEMQREIAKKMSCVLDGRDIGSVVLPNAKFKFFVTADSKVRAERRYKELLERGQTVNFDELHAEIVQRDLQDSTRKNSPLCKAKDAVEVDTSALNIEESVALIKKLIQEKI